MRVSRLEIFGFKSFLNRLSLPLEGGITGVVGPNGCGKSNIVDAIRWVLGETRASNLRGELLEDVIFNGTDKLRPLGLAEVSISLRSSGDNFFSDLLTPPEVLRLELGEILTSAAVSTETEAGAETNPQQQRAERLAASGLKVIEGFKGKDKPEGDKSGDDKSGDNANAIEINSDEITGELPELPGESEDTITPEHVGTSEASSADEPKSDPALAGVPPGLLQRFSWLKATNEVQITRRLYRSGESEFFINRVPCKLKDIKDLLRAVGLGPRSYTIVAQGEVGRIISARPEDRRAIIEEAAGVLGIKERIAAAKRRLEETKANLLRLDDVVGEVTRQVASLKRQAARAEARAELKARLETIDTQLLAHKVTAADLQLAELTQKVAEFQQSESSARTDLSTAKTNEESARAALSAIEAQGDALRLEVDQIREELNRHKGDILLAESRLSEAAGQAKLKEEEALGHAERARGLVARREQLEREKQEAQAELETVSNEVAAIERSNDDELRLAQEALHASREALRKTEGAVRHVRENVVRAHTRATETERHLVASSPLTQIAKTLGERSELSETLKRISKPLSDALTVPAELTTAVRAVLGEKAGFLVAPQPYEVAKLAASGGHIGGQSGNQGHGHQSSGQAQSGRNGFCIGILRGDTSAQSGGIQPSSAPLGSAQPEASGSDAVPNQSNIEPSSTATGLSTVGLGLPRLLDLIAIAPWAREASEQLIGLVHVAPSAVEATEFFNNARDEQGRVVRRPETVVTRAGEVFTADSFFIFNHDGGVLDLKVRYEQLKGELTKLEAERDQLQATRDTAQHAVEQAEQRHRTALAESQARQQALRALLNRQGNAKGRLDATERVLKQTLTDAERAESLVVSCKSRAQEILASVTELQAKLETLKAADTTAKQTRLNELQVAYRALDGQRSEARQAAATSAQAVSELMRTIERLTNEINRCALAKQRIELEREHLISHSNEVYGTEVTSTRLQALNAQRAEGTYQALEGEVATELDREGTQIRNRIAREGDVDPTTIEQYQTENTRLEQLTGQHKDLSSAVETLTSTVAQLEKASVERFVATFNTVAKHFSLLVPRLFGGGRGEIVLTDAENPLQAGVEILVRPPGKKPKSIELLSGGEKALCATALIFAMFLVRPSPLCVLDEVDAPLDEGNLIRLVTMIKEMSKRTQFLMITHNKQSMSMADSLVGVTMQDPGSTQVLTVSLNEAYRHAG